MRRAEDPCGPQLTAAAAAEKGGRTHRPGTVPFRHTLSHSHTRIHTHAALSSSSPASAHTRRQGGGHAGAGSAVETVSLNIFSSSDGEDGDCFFFPSPLPSSPLSSFTTILRIMVQWWMCGEDMFYSQHGLPVMQLDRDDQVRIKNSKYGGAAEERLSCFFFFFSFR